MVQNLSHLLNPSSVASVGISQPDRFGGMLYQNLKAFNYPGQVFAVNPRYDTIYDQPCYLSIRHLLERPDCALLAGLNRLAPPDLPDVSLSDLRRMLLLNSSIRQLGRKNISQFLRIMPMPVAELLNEWFESDVLKGAIAAPKPNTQKIQSSTTPFTTLYSDSGAYPLYGSLSMR